MTTIDIYEAIKDHTIRTKAMENNFSLFFAYHYGRSFKQFHKDWMKSMQSQNNVFIEGFRASRKTTMAKGFIVRVIIYKKYDYIVRQSYENKSSEENVRDVAKMLCSDSIVNDYGQLFPMETKKEDLLKKSLSNFETTNNVKIVSKSLGQTLRGANTFDMQKGRTERPNLLILDDVDVTKSVQNQLIIEANMHKITNETINAMDPLKRKIIFLGNTIYEDGVVPRFYQKHKNSKSRDCYRQPLLVDNECVRPEVFNETVLQTLQDDGLVSRNQNYMCIPYAGQGIVKRSRIQRTTQTNYKKIVIGVDPASSTKTMSDGFAIVVTGRTGEGKHILEAYNLQGQEKEKDNVLQFVYNLYKKHNASIVNFETITAFIYLSDDLKKMGVAVQELRPHKDKITRLLEHEADLKSGKVKFIDGQGVNELVDQLIMFPNGKHDDLVDAMVFSIIDKTSKVSALFI